MIDLSHIVVGGAPEGFDARLILDEIKQTGRSVMHIARDDKRLVAMEEAIKFYSPDMVILRFPSWDC